MAEVNFCTRGSHALWQPFRTLLYKFNSWRADPAFFEPEGIWIFCGPQGSGKTLSAVQACLEMKDRYPQALVCSNMPLNNVDFDVIPFECYEQLGELENGTHGVIFLLDEVHILWNSLESKNIPFSEMALFCQMRKARRVILGTSQVYSRIAKPIREQLKYIVDCHNYFGLIQSNDILDPQRCVEINGNISPDVLFHQWWFHRPELYEQFDTLGKIERIDRFAQPSTLGRYYGSSRS